MEQPRNFHLSHLLQNFEQPRQPGMQDHNWLSWLLQDVVHFKANQQQDQQGSPPKELGWSIAMHKLNKQLNSMLEFLELFNFNQIWTKQVSPWDLFVSRSNAGVACLPQRCQFISVWCAPVHYGPCRANNAQYRKQLCIVPLKDQDDTQPQQQRFVILVNKRVLSIINTFLSFL